MNAPDLWWVKEEETGLRESFPALPKRYSETGNKGGKPLNEHAHFVTNPLMNFLNTTNKKKGYWELFISDRLLD